MSLSDYLDVSDEATTAEFGGVEAVVVTAGYSPYLPQTLAAVAAQTHQPARVTLLYCGTDSDDLRATERTKLRDILTDASFGVPAELVDCPAETLGAALASYYSSDDGAAAHEGDCEPWIWILHDDSAPASTALYEALRVGDSSEKIGIVGAKHRDWNKPDRLRSVGIRATRSGRRIQTELGSLDQGQFDGRSDVVAVSTAGMLIRREALDRVGGADPVLGPFGVGFNLSRRVRVAGWRVEVAPRSMVFHAAQSVGSDPRPAVASRRFTQIYNAVVGCPRGLLLFWVLGFALLAGVRAVGRLVTKHPGLAVAELRAGWRLLAAFPAALRSRKRSRSRNRAVRQLEESAWAVMLDRLEARKERREAERMRDIPDPLTLKNRHLLSKAVRRSRLIIVVLSLLLICAHIPRLSALRWMFPESASGSGLFELWGQGWVPAGLGHAGTLDPLWQLLSPIAVILPVQLGVVVAVVFLLTPVIAALSAHAAAGEFTWSPVVRFLAALVWVSAPPFLAAFQAGSVGGALVHALLPAFVMMVMRSWRHTTTVRVGLLSIIGLVMVAAWPGFFVVLVVAACVGIIAGRWGWIWLPIPALALLWPLLTSLAYLEQPWRVIGQFSGPAIPADVTGSTLLTAVLFPSGMPSALQWILVLVVVGLLAILLMRQHEFGPRLVGVMCVPLGIGVGAGLLHLSVGVADDGRLISAWPGLGGTIAWFGLFLIAAAGLDRLRTGLRPRSFGLRHMLLILGTPIAVIAMIGNAALWGITTWHGHGQTLSAHRSLTLPALSHAKVELDASRTLVLYPEASGVRARVVRGDAHRLISSDIIGELSRLEARKAGTPTPEDSLLAAILEDSDGAVTADLLARNAISVVVIAHGGNAEMATYLTTKLSSSAGLVTVRDSAAGTFWRLSVDHTSARLRAGEAIAGHHHVSLPTGEIGASFDAVDPAHSRDLRGAKVLTLAEQPDERWQLTVDGVRAERLPDEMGNSWQLPTLTADSELTFSFGYGLYALRGIQVFIALVTIILAIPLRRKVVLI